VDLIFNGSFMFLLRFALSFTLLFFISACAINPSSNTYLIETKGPYTLDTGDMIRVNIYGDKDISANYRIGDDGAISFPLIGAIDARGLTTQQISTNITLALSQSYMRNPDVTVEIAEYRPFFIQGEVKQAGKFPYVYGMSVRAAISNAGGFTDVADRSYAIVYRAQGDQMVKGKVELDFPIYPGDTIVINDRWL